MHPKKKSTLHLPLALGVILLLAFGLVGTARAYEATHDEVIGKDTVINDDIFISANHVRIDGVINGIAFVNASNAVVNGTINGDLVVMAATVEINGQINGNLITSGQAIRVNGQVTGSAFVASYYLTLGSQASVGRNVYMIGYCLETQPGSQIGIDVSFNGYQILLHGQIGRNIFADAVAFELSGAVGGNIKLVVSAPERQANSSTPSFFEMMDVPGTPPTVPAGMRIAPQASIGGDLDYSSTVEQPEGIRAATPPRKVTFTQTEDPEGKAAVRRRFFQSRVHELVTLLVLGGLATWLIPGALDRAIEQARRPLPALGRGFLLTLVGYLVLIAFLLLAVVSTVLLIFVNLKGLSHLAGWVGIPGAVLALAGFSFLVSYGSKLVVAGMAGHWILQRLRPGSSSSPFWPLLVGILAYILLSAIPIMLLHYLFIFCVTIIGMGAIWLAYRARRSQAEAAALKIEEPIH